MRSIKQPIQVVDQKPNLHITLVLRTIVASKPRAFVDFCHPISKEDLRKVNMIQRVHAVPSSLFSANDLNVPLSERTSSLFPRPNKAGQNEHLTLLIAAALALSCAPHGRLLPTNFLVTIFPPHHKKIALHGQRVRRHVNDITLDANKSKM